MIAKEKEGLFKETARRSSIGRHRPLCLGSMNVAVSDQ